MESHPVLPVANPAVIFRALAEGGVIFSTEDEVYYGLNNVGARVWELLPPATTTLDELVTKLAAEYPEAPAEVIRADVSELLSDLEGHGLVLRPASATRGAPAPGAAGESGR